MTLGKLVLSFVALVLLLSLAVFMAIALPLALAVILAWGVILGLLKKWRDSYVC